jgi:hypothetical protein
MSETRPPMTAGPISRGLRAFSPDDVTSGGGTGEGAEGAGRRPWASAAGTIKSVETTRTVAAAIMSRSLCHGCGAPAAAGRAPSLASPSWYNPGFACRDPSR